jgi:hypothetical protein
MRMREQLISLLPDEFQPRITPRQGGGDSFDDFSVSTDRQTPSVGAYEDEDYSEDDSDSYTPCQEDVKSEPMDARPSVEMYVHSASFSENRASGSRDSLASSASRTSEPDSTDSDNCAASFKYSSLPDKRYRCASESENMPPPSRSSLSHEDSLAYSEMKPVSVGFPEQAARGLSYECFPSVPHTAMSMAPPVMGPGHAANGWCIPPKLSAPLSQRI